MPVRLCAYSVMIRGSSGTLILKNSCADRWTEIGENVKLYQGVTLGALAPGFGQMLRGQKRHPTIEDDVTIYAGATILGGDTIIGRGATIGGNVFITSSVPPQNQVSAEPPKLKYRDRRPKSMRMQEFVADYQI